MYTGNYLNPEELDSLPEEEYDEIMKSELSEAETNVEKALLEAIEEVKNKFIQVLENIDYEVTTISTQVRYKL